MELECSCKTTGVWNGSTFCHLKFFDVGSSSTLMQDTPAQPLRDPCHCWYGCLTSSLYLYRAEPNPMWLCWHEGMPRKGWEYHMGHPYLNLNFVYVAVNSVNNMNNYVGIMPNKYKWSFNVLKSFIYRTHGCSCTIIYHIMWMKFWLILCVGIIHWLVAWWLPGDNVLHYT